MQTLFTIQAPQQHHFCAIARLHRDGIPAGFLSSLGIAFLTQLYRGIATHPGSLLRVALDASGRVSGFIAGTTNTSAMYRHVLIHHGFMLATAAIGAVFRPRSLRNAFETLRYGLAQKKDGPHPEYTGAELLAIAVDSSLRGQGTGKKLSSELFGWLKCNDVHRCRVVTAAADPQSNGFYRSVGFAPGREFMHHGTVMREWESR